MGLIIRLKCRCFNYSKSLKGNKLFDQHGLENRWCHGFINGELVYVSVLLDDRKCPYGGNDAREFIFKRQCEIIQISIVDCKFHIVVIEILARNRVGIISHIVIDRYACRGNVHIITSILFV